MKIIVTSQVFDALNHAKLLKEVARTPMNWPLFGSIIEDETYGELVECELIDGEEIRLP